MSSIDLDFLGEPPTWDNKRFCDGCPTVFEKGAHVATYFSDWIWNEYSDGPIPIVAPQGMYCLNCYEDEIPLPKRGVTEGFIFGIIQFDKEEQTYSVDRIRIMSGSNSSDGIDWDPVSVTDCLFPAPPELALRDATPFSVFTLLYRAGIDLRGFVKEDCLSIPPPAEEHAKLVIRENIRHNPSFALMADSL